MQLNKSVIEANLEMTGGNCYVFYGKFNDETYFSFGLDTFMILDADYGITLTKEFFDMTDGDSYEWEKEHLIKKYKYPSKQIELYVEQTFEILRRKGIWKN
jgi:hypothetical protein